MNKQTLWINKPFFNTGKEAEQDETEQKVGGKVERKKKKNINNQALELH